jgi:hypothetical protein
MIPTEEENKLAEMRIKALDNLTNACAWDLFDFQLNHAQQLARERWNQIIDEQTVFENRYC